MDGGGGGGRADLVHAVQEGPVRWTAADALAKVHQVGPAELHTSEGGDELLDALQQISRWH